MEEKIVCLRLVSGEDLICRLLTEDLSELLVSRPMVIILTQSRKDSGTSVALMPWVPLANENEPIHIRRDDLRIPQAYTPVEEIATMYRNATSNLVLPSASDVVRVSNRGLLVE